MRMMRIDRTDSSSISSSSSSSIRSSSINNNNNNNNNKNKTPGGELFDRIIAKGFYSEKDAAEVTREVLQVTVHVPLLSTRELCPQCELFAAAEVTREVLRVTMFPCPACARAGRCVRAGHCCIGSHMAVC